MNESQSQCENMSELLFHTIKIHKTQKAGQQYSYKCSMAYTNDISSGSPESPSIQEMTKEATAKCFSDASENVLCSIGSPLDKSTATDVMATISCTCQARTQLFQMTSVMGNLTTRIQRFAPLDGEESFWSTDSEGRNEIHDAVCSLFHSLLALCSICNIRLGAAIVKKMELNNKKYPVELCKASHGVTLCEYNFFSNLI